MLKRTDLRPTPLLALLLVVPATRGSAAGPAEAFHAETVRVGQAEFTIRYGPEDAEAARQISDALERAAPVAERWGTLAEPVLITVHPTHEALEGATHREGYPWMRAWARRASVDLQSPRTWSRGKASDAAMVQLLTHELTHCATYQAAGVASGGGPRQIPVWFLEGMATVAAGQRTARRSTLPARDGVLRDPAPLLRSDSDSVYAVAHEAFLFLLARAGSDGVRRLVQVMGDGQDFASAFERAIGMSVEAFRADFDRRGPSAPQG